MTIWHGKYEPGTFPYKDGSEVQSYTRDQRLTIEPHVILMGIISRNRNLQFRALETRIIILQIKLKIEKI